MSEYPPNFVVRQLRLHRTSLRLLVADSSNRYSGSEDYVISGDSNAWLSLPGFRAPYPTLKDYGWIWYRIVGNYQNTAGNTTIATELVVDGTPSGVQVSSGALVTAAGLGCITIDIKLSVVGSADLNTARQQLTVEYLTSGSAGTKTNDVRQTGINAISVTADHSIYPRVSCTTATGDAGRVVDLRSFVAFHCSPRGF